VLPQAEPEKKFTLFDQVLKEIRPVLTIVFGFSFVVNLLNLLTPLYSLQVLDRVLGTQSKETLLFLSLIMAAIYISLHLMQVARSFTLIKLGEWMDEKLSPALLTTTIQNSVHRTSAAASQYLRDLGLVKSFLTSTGINSVFDAPWSIIYIGVLFLIHPWMGWLAVIGALLALFSAVLNAFAVNKKLSEATDDSVKGMNQSDIAGRNAEVIEAMGMMKSVVTNWQTYNQAALNHQSVASYRNGVISNASKFIRAILQMLVTGLGAYLCITRPTEMSSGGMIASSIMVGRAMQPFDQAIELWKQIASAMKSYGKLHFAFRIQNERQEAIKLPTPQGRISFENVFYAPPDPRQKLAPGSVPNYIIKGVSFNVEPGEIVAVIGPSAAGKSTLSKLLVGVWKPSQGVVRLDGADVYSWGREDFGKHVGYLPQDVELFGGTIKDNIARLQKDAPSEKVIESSIMAGAHDMILRLPNGYETDIGVTGSSLSGGQRQRVGLARAFFGDPRLLVLDEPNASLDEAGQQALISAVRKAKERGITAFIVSHRPEILVCVDKILIIQDGAVAAFGPRDEVMARFSTKHSPSGDGNNHNAG
jgi:PrtD family type I secretion system ABC transporter